MWKGQLTMMPTYSDPHGLGYNMHIMEREGIKFPQDGYTWADFDEIGRKVVKPDERRLVDFAYDGHRMLWWGGSNGTYPLDNTRTKLQWDTPPMIQALEYAHNNVTRTKYFIPRSIFESGKALNANYNTGGRLCNSINAGTVTPPRFPDVDPGDGSGIRVTHFPLGPSNTAKQPMTPGNVLGMMVLKGFPEHETNVAVELALHGLRPRVQLLISAASGHAPSNQVAAKDPSITKVLKNNPILNRLNELTQFNQPTPNPPSYLKILGIVQEQLGRVRDGELTVKDGLNEMQRLTQPLLDKDLA